MLIRPPEHVTGPFVPHNGQKRTQGVTHCCRCRRFTSRPLGASHSHHPENPWFSSVCNPTGSVLVLAPLCSHVFPVWKQEFRNFELELSTSGNHSWFHFCNCSFIFFLQDPVCSLNNAFPVVFICSATRDVFPVAGSFCRTSCTILMSLTVS